MWGKEGDAEIYGIARGRRKKNTDIEKKFKIGVLTNLSENYPVKY